MKTTTQHQITSHEMLLNERGRRQRRNKRQCLVVDGAQEQDGEEEATLTASKTTMLGDDVSNKYVTIDAPTSEPPQMNSDELLTNSMMLPPVEIMQLAPFASHRHCQWRSQPSGHGNAPAQTTSWPRRLAIGLVLLVAIVTSGANSAELHDTNLRFDPMTSGYHGLTFTFDPRLDKQVEQRLHYEHWLSIMQQVSGLLYESLNGRAHLAEIKVLIPFKWRQLSAELRPPVLYKPGAPVITNRRLRFTDSDVIVGLEDPVYKETPFALQHDECGRPGLHIRMPISFLDQQAQSHPGTKTSSSQLARFDSRLKARQFVREFASHRYGIFKESGFRSDFMYPPFSSVAGLGPLEGVGSERWARWTNSSASRGQPQLEQPSGSGALNRSGEQQQDEYSGGSSLKGFDEHFNECKFDTSPASGLPANAQAANCLPYLVRADKSLGSFNLMSSDPFSYTTPPMVAAGSLSSSSPDAPVQWEELAEQTKWHFCGENFANPNYSPPTPLLSSNSAQSGTNQLEQTGASSSSITPQATTNSNSNNNHKLVHYEHNQRAANKQNRMCQERSALEVIQLSEDFSKPVSPSMFNRLPAPTFKFLQEMPPRLIMCIEYTSHLFQSRRLDHPILESAINKFLALDLIAESELATVVFGQHQSRVLDSSSFQRLDSNLNSRFTLFNPAIDPFDEQVQFYSQSELAQMGVQSAISPPGASSSSSGSQQQQSVRILKGSCSFAKMMAEVNGLLQKSSTQYDDIGADLIVLTSGLFVEDEARIEEILRLSNFKLENNRLNMILYPSTILFETKSRDGLIVLDQNESEQIIRTRVNKLLLIQRLTGGKLHLIREQLDSSGDVKMSTLTQFYQIFDQLAKGHSWDQTSSLIVLQSQQVDTRQNHAQSGTIVAAGQYHHHQHSQYRLTFQFNVDESVQNELLVGFIDPKVQQQQVSTNPVDRHMLGTTTASHKAGKRFSLKNLQLRSPGGQFVFTETNTTWFTPSPFPNGVLHNNNNYNQTSSASFSGDDGQQTDGPIVEPQESAFFPFRAQLSLAAFHVKAHQLAQLAAVKRLAGTWILSALSDEPIQTSGIAMARANPHGDTLMGNCWIQTYNRESIFEPAATSGDDSTLKMVKVFAQISGGIGHQRQEVEARMEVQDEMGNIVQNVQMLDDGLGAPDMTQNDGIFTQYVQKATRSGFYKISVELTTGSTSRAKLPVLQAPDGQDNICCGSFVPSPSETFVHSSRPVRSTRQLYCGTFFVEPKNRLAQHRPPRVSNLTVVNVDQGNRRVTLRWFEPQLDISSSVHYSLSSGSFSSRIENSQLVPILSENDLIGEETQSEPRSHQATGRASRSTRLAHLSGTAGADGGMRRRQIDPDESADSNYDDHQQVPLATVIGRNVLMASHHQQQERSILPLANQIDRSQSSFQNRYEIQLFTDRDITKRTFDAKDVGFKFNEWSVEGQFPNASQFGGMKEVTLRIPFSRGGFYFIAMKIYNNVGLSSQMSNIVQFYLRNNMTLEEVGSIQPGMFVDPDGNVYDKSGNLVQRGEPGLNNQLSSYSLLKGTTSLDGLSVLILISVLVFMMVILCIVLVACLANSARHSLKNNAANKASRQQHSDDKSRQNSINSIVGVREPKPISAGSGSSMVSSSGGCESSETGACSGSSSLAGSCTGNQTQSNHVSQDGHLLFDEHPQDHITSYNKLQQQHKNQQQQAHMIHQQLVSVKETTNRQQQDYCAPSHTIVNGYTYATVLQSPQQQHQQQHPQQEQYQQYSNGNLNQASLLHLTTDSNNIPTSLAVINGVQSWPADILMSHYDKVKQARERNEAPPVMRIETLEHSNGLHYSDGLPIVFDNEADQSEQQQVTKGNQYSSLGHSLSEQKATYYNQQLHQQLSSVLKFKRQNLDYNAKDGASSPALDGVAGELLNSGDDEQTGRMPPPPHYMYCPTSTGLPIDNNGLSNQLVDPSIYSQVTNLQQVSAGNTVQDNLTGYYANQQAQSQQQQWPTMQTGTTNHNPSYGSASMISSGIYSPPIVGQSGQSGDAAISEV